MTTVSSNKKTARSSVNMPVMTGLRNSLSWPPSTSPLLNFFMPTQKLKSKTRIGSKEIKVYNEPQSPFQRLIESNEVSHETKDSLRVHIALYNPVELQHNVNKAVMRLRQRLAQSNRIITRGQE
jgi:hypothetical protein